jgi:hypothetical protein
MLYVLLINHVICTACRLYQHAITHQPAQAMLLGINLSMFADRSGLGNVQGLCRCSCQVPDTGGCVVQALAMSVQKQTCAVHDLHAADHYSQSQSIRAVQHKDQCLGLSVVLLPERAVPPGSRHVKHREV